MDRTLDVDYLVIGAGAAGMAFTDALIDHADVRVALVDRRDGPGGHWRGAYPFVRLHQASSFYGVASTVLGGGRVQQDGPEAGLHERADQPTILAYYEDVLAERMTGPGRVELLPGCDVEGRVVHDRTTGERWSVPARCRVVDARYLAPEIPAETPPRFHVGEGVRVVPVNDLEQVEEAGQVVVVGSGKTATDAVVRLLARGTDPAAICWVRPREPWMLNRAVVQPDPEVYLAMVAEMMRLSSTATSLPDLFVDLEAAGIMLRIDPAATPTMAKAPTLGAWELAELRRVEHVVRLGHVTAALPGRLELDGGSVDLAPDAVVLNCAADGLKNRPLLPVWGDDAITLQPVRAGFPCFGAALIGYVEATRDQDGEKNRLCAPSSLGNTLEDWARMNVTGLRSAAAFAAAPDVKEWADRVALNPARVAPDHPGSPGLDEARAALARHVPAGVARLAELAGPA